MEIKLLRTGGKSFKRLLNEKNERRIFEKGTREINRHEIKEALREMKNGLWWKAGRSAEKSGRGGSGYNTEANGEGLQSRENARCGEGECIVPINKFKGDIQDCENYRGIKFMPQNMKNLEIMIEKRFKYETEIGEQQFWFMPGKGIGNL